jgi:hypothetical protein
MRQASGRPASLDVFRLSDAERLKLAVFLGSQRDWAIRHAPPLDEVVSWYLHRHWIEVLRFDQIVPHPVYELRLRLGRSSPSTKEGIGVLVRQAFAAAGRKVGSDYVNVCIRRQSAKAVVYVG